MPTALLGSKKSVTAMPRITQDLARHSQEAPTQDEKASDNVRPTINDVLYHSDERVPSRCVSWPGNKYFQALLRANYGAYSQAEACLKLEIIKNLATAIYENDGRFLQKHTQGGWRQMGDEQVKNRIQTAFAAFVDSQEKKPERAQREMTTKKPKRAREDSAATEVSPTANDVLYYKGKKPARRWGSLPGNKNYEALVAGLRRPIEVSGSEITDRDVLFTRAANGSVTLVSGNGIFQERILAYSDAYAAAGTMASLNQVVTNVIKDICAKNGRFLVKEKQDLWHNIDDTEVRLKIGAAFAESYKKKPKRARKGFTASGASKNDVLIQGFRTDVSGKHKVPADQFPMNDTVQMNDTTALEKSRTSHVPINETPQKSSGYNRVGNSAHRNENKKRPIIG